MRNRLINRPRGCLGYAAGHGYLHLCRLPLRPRGRRMGAGPAPPPTPCSTRPTSSAEPAHDSSCGLLPRAGRRGVAPAAPRVSPLEDRLNGLITNDKFCLTRCGRLALTWPRSHPLPRAWRQGSAAYAPRDDPHRRGGRHASPAHALVAPPPSTVPSPGRAAALGSRVSFPPALPPNPPCPPATAREPPVARTGEGGGPP